MKLMFFLNIRFFQDSLTEEGKTVRNLFKKKFLLICILVQYCTLYDFDYAWGLSQKNCSQIFFVEPFPKDVFFSINIDLKQSRSLQSLASSLIGSLHLKKTNREYNESLSYAAEVLNTLMDQYTSGIYATQFPLKKKHYDTLTIFLAENHNFFLQLLGHEDVLLTLMTQKVSLFSLEFQNKQQLIIKENLDDSSFIGFVQHQNITSRKDSQENSSINTEIKEASTKMFNHPSFLPSKNWNGESLLKTESLLHLDSSLTKKSREESLYKTESLAMGVESLKRTLPQHDPNFPRTVKSEPFPMGFISSEKKSDLEKKSKPLNSIGFIQKKIPRKKQSPSTEEPLPSVGFIQKDYPDVTYRLNLSIDPTTGEFSVDNYPSMGFLSSTLQE
jgi:hypothetical protein